jgi:GNAT superfamily N-acetyltransferase
MAPLSNSLWANYNKERLGWDSIEESLGAVLYSIRPPTATIEDIYVEPEARRSNLALSLANRVQKIAREAGCTELLTQVWVGAVGSERAVRVNIAYGFKMISADGGRILFRKEL